MIRCSGAGRTLAALRAVKCFSMLDNPLVDQKPRWADIFGARNDTEKNYISISFQIELDMIVVDSFSFDF